MASGGGGRRRRKARPRARGKGKKTKYLSLSDLLVKAEVGTPPRSPGDEPAPAWEEAEVKRGDGGDGGGQQQQQVEQFALHHEASTLFAALPAPSLSDILGASAGGVGESPSPSASPDGGSGFTGAEEEDLARRALRGRERWVYCSSGSSPTATTATTSSSSPCSSAASTGASARSLLLKLDYEEILAAWADRGSLYIGGGGGGADSDAAPELGLDAVLVEVEPSENTAGAPGACAWSAPEMAPAGPERAEKVRRYKEKRRNRLFAKRIRYEVRRVNAVKRPRFKGRFIKEHEESELQPT
ncbi:hypothetical protein GQ55_6G018600 [Panicum hallii var. hallii]|uniref:CCT domain-containing protein n=1 Tax=Panicum hallii var. hallii TaxID=1504633 RepID=A0A2T7D2V5_9POAL|nr:hypothetical protein GQ55_6G018600 [Panicum hallii var. hallii]